LNSQRPDPSAIMALATGYWNSATLLAANELGLFGALADGPQTAAAVAARLHTGARATAMLLDACTALGLLAKQLTEPLNNPQQSDEPTYANTAASAAFLVPGSPGYLGGAIRWGADQYGAWGRLAQSVRENAPAVPPADHLGADPEQTRTFVLGMHNRAMGVARGVIHFLEFAGTQRLLDVGGGSGAYAALLAAKYPQLQATVLDLPAIVTVARELIAQSEARERVLTVAGDAASGDYGDRCYDAVLFSGVLHQMGPHTIRRMLSGAWRALTPGGRIVICDMMLDSTGTQPVFAALFSLQMLLTSAEGAAFAAEQCAAWLAEAGFQAIEIKPLPPPLPYVAVQATKPD
jgi:ubiquinone/menaquinone biosynthesis C-methylase UbiE